MNAAGVNAIRSALANVEDNLYRYKHFAAPDGCTGNGEPIRDVIAALEEEREQLANALNEANRA